MAAKYKKRKDGRYLVQIQTGIQDNGKPKYKNIYAYTIKELEGKAATFRQELERGIVINDDGLTVEAWARKWLEIYKSNKEYYTIEMYSSIINAHIIPFLGRYRLSELRTHHIQEMINQRAAEGLTRTLEKIKITLNQILTQAVKNEFIYKNVLDNVQFPKKEKPAKRSLTTEEKQLISRADFDLKEKAFVFTLLYTGLRRGEILALTKNDINLKDKTITVNKAVVMKGNRSEIKNSPKTESSNRVIPIINDLLVIMLQYLPNVDSIYAFPSAHKNLMSKRAFRCFWDKVVNKINVAAGGTNTNPKVIAIANDITPHIFRHTYATMLYYAGVDIKSAQYLLGHSSIQVTMDIYTHYDVENNNIAVDRLNSYLSHDDAQQSIDS